MNPREMLLKREAKEKALPRGSRPCCLSALISFEGLSVPSSPGVASIGSIPPEAEIVNVGSKGRPHSRGKDEHAHEIQILDRRSVLLVGDRLDHWGDTPKAGIGSAFRRSPGS